MIGIVVPAHDEAGGIAATLASLVVAGRHPALDGEDVAVVVVLDSCTDGTAGVVGGFPVSALAIDARNVGIARAAGAENLLARGARWLAFTDADTVVDPAWLVQQLALGADAVCGTIAVADWALHGADASYLRHDFETTYTDADGHRHIHGANLGVSAEAYRRAGGFAALRQGEDVALVEALHRCGAHVAFSAAPRVTTSARTEARAQGGFGDAILAALARGEAKAFSNSGIPPA